MGEMSQITNITDIPGNYHNDEDDTGDIPFMKVWQCCISKRCGEC